MIAFTFDAFLCWVATFTTVRPNKKLSVFRVTGLKILGRVDTYFFYYFFFLEKI